MITYQYVIDDGYVRECDSCQVEAPLHDFGDRKLCELCATSFVGNATQFQEHYQNVSLFIAIAQIGNIVLDHATGRRKSLPDQ